LLQFAFYYNIKAILVEFRAGPRSMCECAGGARSVRSGAAILPQRFTGYEDAFVI